MRVVGLISGGKDSIYNCMQCVAAGHDLVALANIHPDPTTGKDELDSYMFQTVGHEGINLIADAMGLPLYRQTTSGKATCPDLCYKLTDTTDEVEDLFILLEIVKQHTNCEGVAVGAIASDYQRNRVEHVCSRLQLTSLSYLWKLDQHDLLRSMIDAQVKAIIVKVASMGLVPEQHLGMDISKLEPIVSKLNKDFGVNVCGEGGEYESFVLDCPLYHQKITIDESEIRNESVGRIGASGYLSIQSARLEAKFGKKSPVETYPARVEETRRLVQGPLHYAKQCDLIKFEEVPSIDEPGEWTSYFVNAYNIPEAVVSIQDHLSGLKMGVTDISFVNLWIKSMADFADINKEYVAALAQVTPSRACVATKLPESKPVLLEIAACLTNQSRSTVHVQSISHWAPANIGPYSQAVKVDGIVFVAGQIPLVPGSMVLLEESIEEQVTLAARHASRVLNELRLSLHHAVLITVVVSNADNLDRAVSKMNQIASNTNTIVVGLVVQALPRYADVEILVVAAVSECETSTAFDKQYGNILLHGKINASKNMKGIVCHFKVQDWTNPGTVKELKSALEHVTPRVKCNVARRLLYDGDLVPEQILAALEDHIKFAIIPIVSNENRSDFTFVGLGTYQ